MKRHFFLAFALTLGLVLSAKAQDDLSKPIPILGFYTEGSLFLKKDG